ncbi:ParA family protein [Tessaracoccus caeni]|uniref:ParA family protein n=1 Tax=Tessaracoccus caeni TaxID=3031239 RepID=UPI0023D9BAD3|nr:ParA family protein [Tessaracoccus caeni]MDF1488103.1 ParA family protein [Tessaracoccus caeni]
MPEHGDPLQDYGDEYSETTVPLNAERLPRPKKTRVFVVANQKGGVGKTTTAVNVGMALALGGLNVLVIDNDPQANASTALGVDHPQGTKGTYEVLIDGDEIAAHAQRSNHSPNLHVLPATIDLAAAELELVNISGREHRLKDALDRYIEQSGVDYVFIDCPPSLGLLTLNALVAATELIVPIQCEYYALEGVTALMDTIRRVKANLNTDLELSTILLTMFDRRTNLAKEVSAEVRAHFPRETLETSIPRSVRVAEAPSFAQSVVTYQPKSDGASAYIAVATEIAFRADRMEE